MKARDFVSALGLAVAALLLAGSATRTLARSTRGAGPDEARLLASSRFSAAIGCTMLGTSYLFTKWLAIVPLLITAVAGLMTSIFLESARRRRIAEKRPEK